MAEVRSVTDVDSFNLNKLSRLAEIFFFSDLNANPNRSFCMVRKIKTEQGKYSILPQLVIYWV